MQAANSGTSWCTAAGSSFGLPAGLGCWLSGDRRDRRHGADGDNLGHDRKRIHLRAACEVPQTWSADRYGVQMASPSASSLPADPAPPPADPIAIRACLSPRLVAKFDADWDVVLEQAKVSKDLAGVHGLLHRWRHLAYAELRDPGCYFRLQAKAEQIICTGENPRAGSFEDMQALIRERLRR
jgi:hypothetical protein